MIINYNNKRCSFALEPKFTTKRNLNEQYIQCEMQYAREKNKIVTEKYSYF